MVTQTRNPRKEKCLSSTVMTKDCVIIYTGTLLAEIGWCTAAVSVIIVHKHCNCTKNGL